MNLSVEAFSAEANPGENADVKTQAAERHVWPQNPVFLGDYGTVGSSYFKFLAVNVHQASRFLKLAMHQVFLGGWRGEGGTHCVRVFSEGFRTLAFTLGPFLSGDEAEWFSKHDPVNTNYVPAMSQTTDVCTKVRSIMRH